MRPHYAVLQLLAFSFFASQVSCSTQRPIIGIVCQEVEKPPDCYIAASYVKAVEAAGARVAPIFISRGPDYYRRMVKNLNGVVFPGGGASLSTVGGYFSAAASIFKTVRKLNYAGDHFPVFGVCLGLEFLATLSNLQNKNQTLEQCPGLQGKMLPLELREGFRNSSLFRGASQQIIDILSKKKVTPNYHRFCLRPWTILRHPWRILSTNKDGNGEEFVSSMETDGPMAALQFHPEKNAFEWALEGIPSNEEALLASRHFYDWLVTEARKNDHSFSSKAEEQASLIYNYNPTFTGKNHKSHSTQIYYFNF